MEAGPRPLTLNPSAMEDAFKEELNLTNAHGQLLYRHLKSSLDPDQIADRLQYRPQTMELHLFEVDVEQPERIAAVIQQLQGLDIKVFLHHPMKIQGKYLDILSDDPEVFEYYRFSCRVLHDICQEHQVYCVVHPHYSRGPSGRLNLGDNAEVEARSIELRDAIEDVRSTMGEWFLWENTPTGVFSNMNPLWLTHIVAPLELPVCYDISHSFMSLKGDNRRLVEDVRALFPYTRYYHVVDSLGTVVHDALPLGQGRIDWRALKPYIVERDFIFEIGLQDQGDCTAMVESATFFAALPSDDLDS